MRTIIERSDEQLAELREICEAEGISRAEAVRQAVQLLVADRRASNWDRSAAASFGVWKDNPLDALGHERKMREEWER